MKTVKARLLDMTAIGLSGLCLAHCLILPVIAALLPALTAWTHAEWVHLVFVLIAAPLSGFAFLSKVGGRRAPAGVLTLAAIGLAGLVAGVAGWPSHGSEEVVTIVGSLFLTAAHLWNWRRIARETARTQSHGPHHRH